MYVVINLALYNHILFQNLFESRWATPKKTYQGSMRLLGLISRKDSNLFNLLSTVQEPWITTICCNLFSFLKFILQILKMEIKALFTIENINLSNWTALHVFQTTFFIIDCWNNGNLVYAKSSEELNRVFEFSMSVVRKLQITSLW